MGWVGGGPCICCGFLTGFFFNVVKPDVFLG